MRARSLRSHLEGNERDYNPDSKPTALRHRYETVVVPPLDSGQPVWVKLIHAEAAAVDWRVIELFSLNDSPFEADIIWTTGTGTGAHLLVTVPRATIISVSARSVTIRVASLSSSKDTKSVGVTIEDAHEVTRNIYEVAGASGVDLFFDAGTVPPFANRVRLDISDNTVLAAAEIQLIDGSGTVRTHIMGDEQPGGGLLLGNTQSIELKVASGRDYRLIYYLSK